MSDDQPTPLKETPLGTVIRPEWTDAYYKLVAKAEMDNKKAICGAPRKDGEPCRGHPNEKYGWFCRLHKYSGELQLTSQEAKHPAKVTPRVPILLNDEIRNGLARCNICPVRNRCELNLVGHYCRLEERIVNQFMDTAKQDYEISPLDEFQLIAAALSYIVIIRARLNQSMMSSLDAEAAKLSWLAPREQKEFIRLMKELGLTRKERMDQETRRAAVGKPAVLADGSTLGQLMMYMGKQQELIVTQQVTVKEKDPNVIDVEADVVVEEEEDA